MQQRVLVLFQNIEYVALAAFLRKGTRGSQCFVLGILQLCLQTVDSLHVLLALVAESHIDDGEGNDQDKQPYL